MIGKAALFALIIVAASPVVAATICENGECTVTERGASRKMSAKEVDLHMRKGNLATVEQLHCQYSDDAAKCEAALSTLRKLFVY